MTENQQLTKSAQQVWQWLYGDAWPEGLRMVWRKQYKPGHRGRSNIYCKDMDNFKRYATDEWRDAEIDRKRYWIAMNPAPWPERLKGKPSRAMPYWFLRKWTVFLDNFYYFSTMIHEFTHVRGNPNHNDSFWQALDKTLTSKFSHLTNAS